MARDRSKTFKSMYPRFILCQSKSSLIKRIIDQQMICKDKLWLGHTWIKLRFIKCVARQKRFIINIPGPSANNVNTM